ncbi:MAG TPA: heme-copper oxidase subunit III [Bryobacteraceae bacterium]|nr:heme-copper oxidase subunit III [Bryobacteraceae bacterium]
MSSIATTPNIEWKMPDRGRVGVICLITTETALFTIFVVAYLFYIGKSLTGPYPKDVLEFPVWATIALLSSSLTVFMAEHSVKHGRMGAFKLWLGVTILLGAEFLRQTGIEWYQLIEHDHLTITTNLFGTTFYSLVGLHASHVTIGLILLLLTFLISLGGGMKSQARRFEFLSWYWHFVDAIWIVVFTVVYIVGR